MLDNIKKITWVSYTQNCLIQLCIDRIALYSTFGRYNYNVIFHAKSKLQNAFQFPRIARGMLYPEINRRYPIYYHNSRINTSSCKNRTVSANSEIVIMDH